MCKIVPVPTLKSAFAQNPKVITFSGTEPPYGYLDWCPISMGLMMWMMMGRNHNQMSASGPDPRMAELESQVNELRVALQDQERRAGATLRESGSSLK